MSDLAFYVAVLSLVDGQGRPLKNLVAKHLAWLLENGVDGVLVMGTNGEFPHFNVSQRQAYLETVLETIPDGLELMLNIGASNMADVLELQRHAVSTGRVDKILWMPPFYYPGEELNGLPQALDKLLDKQPDDFPFYLYHYPRMSQVTITQDLLMRSPKVRGMKDSSGDFDRIAAMIAACPDKEIYVGTDHAVSRCKAIGAEGVIGGLGNLFPRLLRKAIDDQPNTELENDLRRLRNACETYSKLPGFKGYLNHLSLAPGEQTSLMLPMAPLDARQIGGIVEHVDEILEGVGHYVSAKSN